MATIFENRKMTAPEIHPEHEQYWTGTAEGKLFIKKCNDCEEFHHYPRVFCPHCYSENVEWVEAKGTGKVYSYSVMRVGKPYAMAYVELDEGVRMMTNIVDCDLDDIAIDKKVKVVFKVTGEEGNEGAFVPCFTLAD